MDYRSGPRRGRRPGPGQISLSNPVFVVLGNQLFPARMVLDQSPAQVYLAEDVGLCTYERHHKQKIVMCLAAMRSYADDLAGRGCRVHYNELQPAGTTPESYEDRLQQFLEHTKSDHVVMWEIEDKFFETRIREFAARTNITVTFLPSPMFLTERPDLDTWLSHHRPFMAEFYKFQRKRLEVLVESDGNPVGGQWSFDHENREPLPSSVSIPTTQPASATGHVQDLIPIVNDRFGEHPGALNEVDWWLPTTRRQSLAWLRRFLDERFAQFGPYEDALSVRDPVLFHSVLSPLLNLGLITPAEVLERALQHAARHNVPINSLEGFVRQLIGWREFVRGVYQKHSEEQELSNVFGHARQLTDHWYDGTTGIPPLDHAIQKAHRLGWAHHIERLMVIGNMMTLCEIDPQAAHRWFMEMFVDSSDWVMGPNVYGMAIHSDGGIFATKPYICGSNYLTKMGDWPKQTARDRKKGTTWHDVVDGLYWRFIDKQRDYLKRNARMAQMVSTYDRMASNRKTRIHAAAEEFLDRMTTRD